MKLADITLSEPLPNVHHLLYPNQEDMCKALLRPQEFYECPRFKGTIFSYSEYKKWYRKQTAGKGFSYYGEVVGHNFPSSAIQPFREGRFDRLRRPELQFLKKIAHLQGDFYIIATAGDGSALKHELCHGLYYTNKHYRKNVITMVSCFREELIELVNYLKDTGYDESVMTDEIQAWLIADSNWLDDENVKYPIVLRNLLRALYKETMRDL